MMVTAMTHPDQALRSVGPREAAAAVDAAKGEPILWAGRSSGVIERIQGCLLTLFAAPIAFHGLPALFETWNAARTLAAGAGAGPGWPGLGAVAFGALLLFAGGAALLFAWKLVWRGGRVLWVVTPTRIIRTIVGAPRDRMAWTAAEVLSVTRHREAHRRDSLTVMVFGRGGDEDAALIISGPSDEQLDAAEAALWRLAPTARRHGPSIRRSA